MAWSEAVPDGLVCGFPHIFIVFRVECETHQMPIAILPIKQVGWLCINFKGLSENQIELCKLA